MLIAFRNESIGVTTGRAFCGVVGHRDRHEYTGNSQVHIPLTDIVCLVPTLNYVICSHCTQVTTQGTRAINPKELIKEVVLDWSDSVIITSSSKRAVPLRNDFW